MSDEQQKRKDAIARTGQLMLQGWRLLAHCCPICYTALLSSRDGQLRCPYCDLPVVIEKQNAEPNTSENLPVVEETDEVDDEELDQFEADIPTSLEDLRKEYETRNSKSSNVSQLLGEKMLQGWTMLSEICPTAACKGTPLMRLGKAPAAMQCMSCNCKYIHDEAGDLIIEGSKKKEVLPQPAVQETNQKYAFAMDEAPILNLHSFSNKNDPSQKISQKLMKGWALLDKCCTLPGCIGNIPLLRDKEEKLFCVECGYQDKPNVKQESRVVVEKKRSNSLDEDDDEEETRKIAAKLQKITSSVISSATKTQVGTKPNTTLESVRSAPCSNIATANALAILNTKLEHATSLLEKEANVEKLIQLAVLISKLAEAIDSLNRLT